MKTDCLLATKRRHPQAGFTLIEVMVVILIIGIIINFASLSVGQSVDQEQEQEAKRLTALLKLAGEESIFNSRELVLELFKGGYRFVELNPMGQRQALEEEEVTYRARELPPHLQLRAEINGEEAALTHLPQDGIDPPAVYLLSSGEMTPFVIDVVNDEKIGYRVEGAYSGEVAYSGRQEL